MELDPNDVKAYFNRALSKFYYNDLSGVCQDARKAQSLSNYINIGHWLIVS